MKKAISIVLFVSALTLISGIVSAQTIQAESTSTNYTAEQKACIKTAQDKRTAALKVAIDQMKSATKDASDAEQAALTIAQKSKTEKIRLQEIKKAVDAYNNNETVKQAKAPYLAAVKAANDKFQIESKSCLSNSGKGVGGFFSRIGNNISSFFSNFFKFFSKKK